MSARKTLQRLLTGNSDAAIRFDDLCLLLEGLGFETRMKGSHHIFRKEGVDERINLSEMAPTRSRIKSNRCALLS